MTEEEANDKLSKNYKSYFNRTNGITKYAAVVKQGENNYVIELGIKNKLTPINIEKMLVDAEELRLEFDNKDIIFVESDDIELQCKENYKKSIKRYGITSGISVFDAKTDDSSGTAGAFFKIAGENETFMISNYHVIASDNRTSSVIHPSMLDAENSGLKNKKLEIGNVIWKCNENMDAAIAKITAPVSEGQYSRCKGIKYKGIGLPKIGIRVKKCGRTTGLTFGVIKSINCIVNISNTNEPKLFLNQIFTTGMTKKGDSGSVLVNEDNIVVGLFFAGNKKGSFFNIIKDVFCKFSKDKNKEFEKFV